MATELNGLGNFVECSQSNEPLTKNNTELTESEESEKSEIGDQAQIDQRNQDKENNYGFEEKLKEN